MKADHSPWLQIAVRLSPVYIQSPDVIGVLNLREFYKLPTGDAEDVHLAQQLCILLEAGCTDWCLAFILIKSVTLFMPSVIVSFDIGDQW